MSALGHNQTFSDCLPNVRFRGESRLHLKTNSKLVFSWKLTCRYVFDDLPRLLSVSADISLYVFWIITNKHPHAS